ncbi:nuclear transport factor 2 family protein [Streptomyces shenzhenensis]|uniref:nuclear transport factor 2 family protein n=1 Tax=Streptomyces shenzhenensis TaxID=943815 RepID=UPI00215D6ABB|nr:nuclear transport factor 2 family protein [Streptomyces shenzhenensis]
MTNSSTISPAGGDATVELAEAAWLEATTATEPDAMRRLMHPECVVVHAPVGRIDGVEAFLGHTARLGRITAVQAYDVTVQRFDRMAIVSCLQEMGIAFLPDLTPFVVQAAATRVWLRSRAGWRLAHMQLARRQPPG